MDRISGLSDELLVKILSLVPTKVAVSTSILSKRWEYLWMWLPKLKYGHRRCSDTECERLRCFLDMNLPLHKAPVIELDNSIFKPENINLWVAIAVSHGVRDLDILYESNPIVLPSILFTCESLVILKLDGTILLDVPRMVSLPSLKTLQLQRLTYLSEKNLQRLLSNCPILEDLVVDLRGYTESTRTLTVVVPSLQSLSLYIHFPDADEYVIETPSLKYFRLIVHSSSDHYCLIGKMPYLLEAHIDVKLPDITSVIGSITSVKRLTICSQTMFDEDFVFNQLEHLEVCLCKTHSSNQLVRLLNSSSNLQGLHLFYMGGHDPYQGMDEWNEPSTVPECLLSSLQSLSWSMYKGEPQEREIVVYILKHALHLKTATITSSFKSDIPKFEMLKELALSSRASPTCQLVFE